MAKSREPVPVSFGDQWTKEADELLLNLKDQGLSYWQISQQLPGRTDRAIQARWRRLRDRREDARIQAAMEEQQKNGNNNGMNAAPMQMVHPGQVFAQANMMVTTELAAKNPLSLPAPLRKRVYLDTQLHNQPPPKGGQRMADLDVTSTHGYRKLQLKGPGSAGGPSTSFYSRQSTPGLSQRMPWISQPAPERVWSLSEDQLLLTYRQRSLAYDEISQKMPWRTVSEIEKRYLQALQNQQAGLLQQAPLIPHSAGLSPEQVKEKALELMDRQWDDTTISTHLALPLKEVQAFRAERDSGRNKRHSSQISNSSKEGNVVGKRYKKWSPEEEEKLKQLKISTDISTTQIAAKFPDRSPGSVDEHWAEMQLHSRPGSATGTPGSSAATPVSDVVMVRSNTPTGAPDRTQGLANFIVNIAAETPPPESVGTGRPIDRPLTFQRPTTLTNPPQGLGGPPTRTNGFVHTVFVPNSRNTPAPVQRSAPEEMRLRELQNLEIIKMRNANVGWPEIRQKFPDRDLDSIMATFFGQRISRERQMMPLSSRPGMHGPAPVVVPSDTGVAGPTMVMNRGMPSPPIRREPPNFLPEPREFTRRNQGVPEFFMPETYKTFYKDYKPTPPMPPPEPHRQSQPQSEPQLAPQGSQRVQRPSATPSFTPSPQPTPLGAPFQPLQPFHPLAEQIPMFQTPRLPQQPDTGRYLPLQPPQAPRMVPVYTAPAPAPRPKIPDAIASAADALLFAAGTDDESESDTDAALEPEQARPSTSSSSSSTLSSVPSNLSSPKKSRVEPFPPVKKTPTLKLFFKEPTADAASKKRKRGSQASRGSTTPAGSPSVTVAVKMTGLDLKPWERVISDLEKKETLTEADIVEYQKAVAVMKSMPGYSVSSIDI